MGHFAPIALEHVRSTRMKKRTLPLLLTLALTLSPTACGADDPPAANGRMQPDVQTEAPAEPEAPTVELLPPADPVEATRYAFGKVLWDAYQQGVLPDGTYLDWRSTEEAAQNDFILYDVDFDGQEELLLYWGNACTAGQKLIVFGCQDGEVYTELYEYPAVTFYNTGTAIAEWSHNQGLSGNTDFFWPYDLYQYDSETDTYKKIADVDGWSREHPASADGFPTDIDADGDGMVYFLTLSDQDDSLHSLEHLVDGPEYESWRDSYLDGAEPLIIPTQKLTEDSIAALGYPKPEVPVSEPVG